MPYFVPMMLRLRDQRRSRGRVMNRLSLARQTQIISALVEGNSIRSVERMTNTHRDTVMRLMVSVGQGCAKLADEQMRGLTCQRLQMDEIWTYVAKKQRFVTPKDDGFRVGDQWTFVALDADTKLVPAYRVGKRDLETATAFVGDLSERLINRVQLSSDALAAYVEATEQAFGADVDYGQIVKIYEAEPIGPGRYSPPHVTSAQRRVITGRPAEEHISTSFVERQNLTMRMSMRRFTRLTNAFSKKVENLKAAVALHFSHYNLVRIHKTLRVTPAMAAGVTNHLWTMEELVENAKVA
jgi:IS1 family transposase